MCPTFCSHSLTLTHTQTLSPSLPFQFTLPHQPPLKHLFFFFFFFVASFYLIETSENRNSSSHRSGIMGKKRKSAATSLDEVDRTMYASFCSAANSLSQLYTQAMNHQKLSLQAGERHGLEKLYTWICRQQEGESRVQTDDVLNYIQNELDYCGDDLSMSSRFPGQQPQAPMNLSNSGFPVSSSLSVPHSVGHGIRSEHFEHHHPKNTVFSNALSSPVRRSLQHYHIAQGGGGFGPSTGNGSRSTEPGFLHTQTRDQNPPSSNDSLMDMRSDSPAYDSSF